MLEEAFKAQFIASFCAAWCAANYDMANATGKHEYLEKPPIEDAEHLAYCAWQEWLQSKR